jgi:glycolate oxidase FAD binding subunit
VAILAKELNLQIQIIDEVTDFWRSLAQLIWQAQLRNFDSSINNHLVCKLGVLPSAIVSILQQCEQILADQPYYLQMHTGSGLGVLRVEDVQDLAVIALQISKIRSIAESCGGFLSILESPQALKFGNGTLGNNSSNLENVWGYRGNTRDLMVKIQRQFDPRGLLSCDRLYS